MNEHAVLLAAYARAQERCSRLLAEQAVQIEALQAQVVRLRGAMLMRDSAVALVREELAARSDAGFSLSRRLQGLLQAGRGRARGGRRASSTTAAATDLREKAVLCIDRGDAASGLARQLVEIAGGRYLHQHADVLEEADEAALEASLRAADLVVCQTGCVSHGAWWRVQDHCRRTGKPCVMVEQPAAGAPGPGQPVHWLRRAAEAEPR